ncbi:gluconate 2-dehydrogenase subunit 3 family protein [Thalassotalea sp. PLHSN55]|uniref:gluconate 2-dehydrogenase subunit 3 family protein n=1 Tax=Thalassotalea sp. PLHSN55 TaxID=3435888 RepID=UPI003F84240A
MLDIKISRRVFIGVTAFTVSAPILATVLNKHTQVQKVLNDGQFFNAKEMTLLTDVAEIMIPKTDTPGATDAHVAIVLDALMLTWAGKKTKLQFRACLAQIQQIANDTFANDYLALSKSTRTQLITQLDSRAFSHKTTELSASYRKLKEIIFHLYYTSEEANPDFVLIPGGYRGDLTKQELENIHKRGYL